MELQQISALLVPDTYPEKTKSVRHLQTHISHIFITDRFVYKFKKPVDFGFLDFTTLENRHFYCQEELRLNRRLSPDIYLDLVALRRDKNGNICFGGTGEIIEYAVKMLRLPEERMMSRLLDQNAVTQEEIRAVAERVAAFHAVADTDERISSYGMPEQIRANWEENLAQTRQFIGRTITEAAHGQISKLVLALLESDESVLCQRVQDGFVRECDGDLHSGNICLDQQVHIFDCIEFNERFRCSDTAADVAFLAMDIESHGNKRLAEQFVAEYQAITKDSGLRKVLPLYLANRAFIRGKVESLQLDDQQIPVDERSMAALRAGRFFRLARGYLLRAQLPVCMFMTCAPTGCGKSSLAEELSFQLGLAHISSDRLRKQLAGVAPDRHDADIYTKEWNRATYNGMAELAGKELSMGNSVIVDATFGRKADRAVFENLAARFGAQVFIMQLDCRAELVRERLLARAAGGKSESDGTWQVYQQQMKGFELPVAGEGQVIKVDAALELQAMVEQILAGIGLN
jgi:aminoglycoside phosphotransferase family enzyme/predicted kinase